jgi:hypothetical protein
MPARDVAPGENHYHERRSNGERRDDTRTRANSRAANRQDEKESSDEFCYVFVHIVRFVFLLLLMSN